jgi:hypothetical protein
MILALTFEVLKYLLPAVVLYFIARLVVQGYIKNEERKMEEAKNTVNNQITLPLRLQACERLILLLERITPAQAVNRAFQPGMTAFELQLMLIRNIREEYEHNVAQQIYISVHVWALIKSAKEEIIHLINLSASETDAGADGSKLAKILLERWGQLDQNPVQSAIDQLKSEINFLS